MGGIQGHARSVNELLDKKKYQIDYYQREYKWEPKQIRELIEDLTHRFRRNFKPDHERDAVDNYGQYFLGSIIVSEKNNKRFIVDGQQRLTSITLLLAYLDRLQEERTKKRTGEGKDDDSVDVKTLIYSKKHAKLSFNLAVDERTDYLKALIKGDYILA